MARLDYYTIELNIQTVLQAAAALSGVTVEVEHDVNFNEGDHVLIKLARREAPASMQGLSAGTRTRMLVHFELYCMSCHLNVPQARQNRDNLIGNVENVLMADRTFSNSQIATSWFEGGEFEEGQARGAAGIGSTFYSLGTIHLVVDATASN